MSETINMIVGWKEWVSLPELELFAVKAKVDTGANTSSLHAYNIEYFTKNGLKYVRFEVHPIQKNSRIKRVCVAPLVEKKHVRSSSGTQQKRPVIKTSLKIGNNIWTINLNLTNRDSMGMRMLIGREALAGKILVNATHKFLHGKLSQKKSKELYK
jgi:ribosomal protein S6--L-glutamate ligase